MVVVKKKKKKKKETINCTFGPRQSNPLRVTSGEDLITEVVRQPDHTWTMHRLQLECEFKSTPVVFLYPPDFNYPNVNMSARVDN